MPRFDGKNDSTHRWKESRGYSWRKAQQIQIWREISMIIRSKNWKCLSLILHSEDDAVASFEKVEKVKHRFPNLTLVYIPPMAGHMMTGRDAEIDQALNDFSEFELVTFFPSGGVLAQCPPHLFEALTMISSLSWWSIGFSLHDKTAWIESRR